MRLFIWICSYVSIDLFFGHASIGCKWCHASMYKTSIPCEYVKSEGYASIDLYFGHASIACYL